MAMVLTAAATFDTTPEATASATGATGYCGLDARAAESRGCADARVARDQVMSRAAGDALADVVAQVMAGRRAMYYTLTRGYRSVDRIVEAHAGWRELNVARVGVGPEFAVVEATRAGDPHLHGLVALPRPL